MDKSDCIFVQTDCRFIAWKPLDVFLVFELQKDVELEKVFRDEISLRADLICQLLEDMFIMPIKLGNTRKIEAFDEPKHWQLGNGNGHKFLYTKIAKDPPRMKI